MNPSSSESASCHNGIHDQTIASPDHGGDVLEGVLAVGDGDPLVLQRHPGHAGVLPVLGPHVDQGAVPGSMAAVSTLLLINRRC